MSDLEERKNGQDSFRLHSNLLFIAQRYTIVDAEDTEDLKIFSPMKSNCRSRHRRKQSMALAPSSPPVVSAADVVITTVKPIRKTDHVPTIDPSVLDLGSMDALVPVFFAYRLADKSEAAYSQLLHRLKESLQKVLVAFFGFAGRWIANTNGSISERQLLCNDEGVPFIEASVDQCLDSVVHASAAFQPVPELQGFELLELDSTQLKQEMLPNGLPCLFVRVTRFACGGVVVAITFNHMLTDGKGFFNFLSAWADLSRTDATAIKVDHNRAWTENSSFKNCLSKNAVKASGQTKLGEWAFKALEVSASTIESLKRGAKDINKCAPRFVSTGDCILAHVWKSLSRQPSSMVAGKELLVTMNVEGRRRFYDPPKPDLCGNITVTMVAPEIPTHEVREMPVVSIASKIREKLHTTKREEWLGFERLKAPFDAVQSSNFAVIRTTSWFAFPLYDIDFGFGKPYFSSGINNLCTLTGSVCGVYIGPPIPSSSASIATVYIWSTPKLLEALDSDSEFLELFLPQ